MTQPTETAPSTVLFVCTGNAARSVMAAAMLRKVSENAASLQVTSAGTHSIPDLPMSTRTRTALADHDIVDHEHRSAQLDQPMVDQATAIAVFEPMHLTYMRKKHPDAAHKVASLHRLVRELPDGPSHTLGDRLLRLRLQHHAFEPWEEVIDPAGGDLGVFQSSAREIASLIAGFEAKVRVGF